MKFQKSQGTVSNNKRALIIHFVLSLAGFASVVLLQNIQNILVDYSNRINFDLLSIAVTIVGGLFFYLACGYFFLKPTEDKVWLSVIWLLFMTTAVAVASMVGFLLLWNVEAITPAMEVVGSILLSLQVFLNTVGMGILALCGLFEVFAQSGILMIGLFLVVAIIPSGLLYLGLRLRIWKQKRDDVATAVQEVEFKEE